MAAQGLLLGMGIVAGVAAAVSFTLVRAELMFPEYSIFVTSGGTGPTPDGRTFGIVYLLLSATSVFGAAAALGALTGNVISPVIGWSVMVVFTLGAFWALSHLVSFQAKQELPADLQSLSRWLPTAALIPFAWLMIVVAIAGRGILRIWSVAGILCAAIVGVASIGLNRAIMSDAALYAATHLERAADFGPVAICLTFGLVLGIAAQRRINAHAANYGLGICLAVGTVLSILVIVAMFTVLGRQGMPVWYGDYPEAFLPWNFWASVAGFALILFTVAGMIHVSMLPRALPQSEIFQ